MRTSRRDGRMRRNAAAALVRALASLCIAFTVGALLPLAANAGPERLGDIIPEAAPDLEGTTAISWGYESIALEGPLTASSTTSNYYRLRYQFNPEVHVALQYRSHALGGGPGLLSPLLTGADNASVYGLDLGINLLHTEAVPAVLDAEGNVATPWEAGSSFGVGVTLEKLNRNIDNLAQDDSLMRAYLVYSTDLSDKLRAHTYFSTGRVAGGGHTGSWNRVAAGLDYELASGEHPLTLMANAALDIYNFRRPTFNTSRMSRFDVGLRYGISDTLFASAGWSTLNDSENDASGSGLFAGLQYVSKPPLRHFAEVVEDIELSAVEIEALPILPPPEAAAQPAPPADPVPAPSPEPVPTPQLEVALEPEPVSDEPVETAPEPEQVDEVITLPDARAEVPSTRSTSSADPPLMRTAPRSSSGLSRLPVMREQFPTQAEPAQAESDQSEPAQEELPLHDVQDEGAEPWHDAEPEDSGERDYSSGGLFADLDEYSAPPAADEGPPGRDVVLSEEGATGGVQIPLLPSDQELPAMRTTASAATEPTAEEDQLEELPVEDDDAVVSVATVPADQVPED